MATNGHYTTNKSNLVLATGAVVISLEIAAALAIDLHRTPLPAGYFIVGTLVAANYIVAHFFKQTPGYRKYVLREAAVQTA
jgi:uncharacterized RDD family membrane protein YckC